MLQGRASAAFASPVEAVIPAASLTYTEAAQAYAQETVSPWTWTSTYVGASRISVDTLAEFTTIIPDGFSVDQVVGFQIRDLTSTAGTGSVTVYIRSITLSQ